VELVLGIGEVTRRESMAGSLPLPFETLNYGLLNVRCRPSSHV